MISFLFLMCVVGMVAAESENDEGEYGRGTTWRKALCDKANEKLYTEMDACFQMEEKVVVDAQSDCAKEAAPESEGNLVSFMIAGCKDVSLFKKFDKCFDEMEENSDSEEVENSPDAAKCYKDVLKKYGLDDLIEDPDE